MLLDPVLTLKQKLVEMQERIYARYVAAGQGAVSPAQQDAQEVAVLRAQIELAEYIASKGEPKP